MHVRHIQLIAAGLALSAAVAGCGSSSSTAGIGTASQTTAAADNPTLDRIVSATNSKMSANLRQFANVYSNIVATAEAPSTLVITYTFVKHIDPATGGAKILTQGAILDAACNTDFYPAMKTAGIASPTARYVWDNPDG